MQFNLKCLFHEGAILSIEEVTDTPNDIGDFLFDTQLQGGYLVRHARFLKVTKEDVRQNAVPLLPKDIISPLVEAELVSVDSNQIIVRGYQFNVDTSKGTRTRQYWVLRQVETTGP